jgi:hypothetical protein
VAGSLEVLGFGGWRAELPHPDGGSVRIDATAVGARLALDGLPGEATLVFGADPVALGRLSDLVSSLLDRGVSVRSVLVDGARVASVVAGTRSDGDALRGAWDREPVQVDWMRAALGPVERIGPLRGTRAG